MINPLTIENPDLAQDLAATIEEINNNLSNMRTHYMPLIADKVEAFRDWVQRQLTHPLDRLTNGEFEVVCETDECVVVRTELNTETGNLWEIISVKGSYRTEFKAMHREPTAEETILLQISFGAVVPSADIRDPRLLQDGDFTVVWLPGNARAYTPAHWEVIEEDSGLVPILCCTDEENTGWGWGR